MEEKLDFQKKAVFAKPCPFCGSKKVITEKKDHFYESNKCCSYISCLNCGAQIYGDVIYENGSYETSYNKAQHIVLKMWNRRVSA